MVSIFTGTGTGLERGSGALLGGAGVIGSGALGRSGEQVSVNAANGNLVIAQRDEFLAGRGPDVVIARTYNSLGNQSDDNGDNWRQSTDRRIKDKTSTTVVRVSGDGSETTFTWNGSAYVTTDGAGAYDRLTLSGDIWTFTDGDTQATETYEANGSTGTWRLRDEKDSNGVTLSYQYQGSKLWRVATSGGEYVQYGWSGDNVASIVTGYVDAVGNKTLTRTRYGYDAQNRLEAVTVDLSPDDNSIADGKTYRTDYTYYDSSKRVKSITQTDGTSVEFEYDASPSNRVTAIKQTLTGTNGQPVTRLTMLRYEAGPTSDRRVTVITDPLLQETRLEYDFYTSRLMKVTAPKPDATTAAQVVSFGYNGNGDVTSVTDATGATTSYTYTANGLVDTETSPTNEVTRRTYDSGNRLLSMTRSGSDANNDKAEHTARYAYDAKGNLRFSINAEGGVTEYRYDGFGQQIGRIVYTDAKYSAAGFATPDLVSWAAARDIGKAEVTAMAYDLRGNLTSTVTGAVLTDTLTSLAITARSNTSVSLQPTGLYRVEKTDGGAAWNADARSTDGLSGDFVLNIRPTQANLLMMAGVSSDPAANGSWTSLGFAFYMNESGQLYATENGQAGINLNTTYAAGDNLWLARSGTVIRYYKGATYAEALDAGPLRTTYGATGTLFFDSSTHNLGAAFDVGLYRGVPTAMSTPIANGVNTSVDRLANGGYRLTKTGGTNAAWDADARGSRAFAGDFALSIRPVAGDKFLMAGLSRNPGGSASYPNQVWQDLAYSFYFQTNGGLFAMESGNSPSLGSYAAGEQFWIARSGTTLTYYRGDINTPGSATVLRTVQNVTGTLYFDSALYQTGSQVDVAMATASAVPDSIPLVSGNNTAVTAQSDGLWRMTKTGSADFAWNADARSQTSVSGDFILQIRPNQSNRFMMVGVSTNTTNSSGMWNELDYAVYFQDGGAVYAWENRGNAYGLGVSYTAGDSFWITRVGSTISYYRGADFDSAYAAGALRTVDGVTTSPVWVDSSIAQAGASADVAFSGGTKRYSDVPIDSGSNTATWPNGDGTYAIMKLGGNDVTWDADGRSRTSMSGDFALRIRPRQNGRFMMMGLSRNPTASASWDNLDYAFYFQNNNQMFSWEGGGAAVNGIGNYSSYQNYWLIREGSTIYYCTGDDPVSARQNVIRSVGGATGALFFDCSIYQTYAAADIAFLAPGIGPATRALADRVTGIDATVGGAAGSSGGSRTIYAYDTAGRLLSRKTDMLGAESFAYDGLGRVVQSSDANGGSAIITFNDVASDAGTTSTVALVNGLVTTSTYNRAGELIASVRAGQNATPGDASGIATSTYDKLGRLRATFDASGRAQFFLYDAAGRRTAEIGQNGEVAEYRYDAANRIVGTIRYGLRITGTPLARAMAENDGITIDELRPALNGDEIRSWRVYDTLGRLIETIDGDGGVTGYAYDASDRLIRTTSYVNRLATGSLITTPPTTPIWPTSHAGDSVSRTFYDKDGRLLGSLDGEGYLTTVDYDAAGRKVATTSYATATGTQNNLRNQGTLAQLRSGLASAADRTSRWVYDRLGLLRFEIDPIGRVVEYVYDSGANFSQAGQVRQTIRYAGSIAQLANYDIATVGAALTPLAGNVDNRRSFAVYDAAGRVAYAIDATGSVTSFTYDTSGRVTKSVRFAQTRTTTTLPTLAEMDGWRASNAATDENRTTWNYYNARGELRYTAEATGLRDVEGAYLTGFTYDAEGRLTETRRYGTPIALSTADTDIIAVDNSTRTQGFDAGRATRTVYDLLGNVSDTYDGEDIRTHYDYYATGTLLQKTVAFGSSDDAAVTRYTYDAAGRVRDTFTADNKPSQRLRTTVEYDGLGNAVRIIDANGNASTRRYDHAGRLVSETDALSQTREYQYDAFDQLVRVEDAGGGRTYNFYDAAGRLTIVRDAENYLTETSYTDFGEVESVTRRYHKSNNVGDSYPIVVADDSRDAVTKFRYDRLGRVIQTTDAEKKTETYVLNAFGERRQVTGKKGLISSFNYDRRGLLTREEAMISAVDGDTTLGSIVTEYAYDARGNRKKTTEAANSSRPRVTEFAYDLNDRLIETSRLVALDAGNSATASEKLAYDKRGNVTKRTDANGVSSYSWYDALDRVVATMDAMGALVRSTYVVDGSGSNRTDVAYANRVANPQSLTAGGTPPSVDTSAQDRTTLTEFDKLGRVSADYILNYFGGAWNGSSYYTETGIPTRGFRYDAAGNIVATLARDGVWSYAYYDKLGRQTAAVDALGYLTTWEHDNEGNVTTEVRYATATSGASATSRPSGTADAARDRTTSFTYDKLGQRTSEMRHNVVYTTVDAATGEPTTITGDVVVRYDYNALGQVEKKTEATGDVTIYDYDAAGRLTHERRPSFASTAAGGTATPALDYHYDALGNLVETRQGDLSINAATDRTTRYRYGAGGRLLSTIDAADNMRSFSYDPAGRKTYERYDRLLAVGDDSSAAEAIGYQYDDVGRVLRTGLYALASGAPAEQGEHSRVTYNAFGDVWQRFIINTADPNAGGGKLQETSDYDSAGRLWRSNAGDGVQRYFVSDAAGNRTFTIESAGTDIRGLTLQQAIDAANADPTGIVRTVTQYDARGQMTGTRQFARELTALGTYTDLVASRTYNAFGETASETDARGAVTSYAYNTMGRVVQVARPKVTWTDASGVEHSGIDGTGENPIELAGYDQSGRLVASTDANGYVTRRTLLSGTGYGGSEAMVTREWRPDGGSTRMDYDQFGDLRTSSLLVGTNDDGSEVRRDTTNVYDKLGRLTQTTNARGLTDYYTYDQLGQRLRHTNSLLGTSDAETTRYDIQGRVVATRAFGGDITTTEYSWSDVIAATGMGLATGGIVKKTTYANTRTAIEQSDGFGHVVSAQNMGGAVTTTTYDMGGRITARETSLAGGVTDRLDYTYLNTGLARTATRTGDGNTTVATYGYDETGRKTTETTVVDGTTWQNAQAIYDLAGRMTSWTEAGNGTTVAGRSQSWTYDRAGNIRSVTSDGGTRWYRYDEMNRVLVDGGTVQNGAITRGPTGIAITYNAAGERATVTSYYAGTYYTEDNVNEGHQIAHGFDGEQRETYGYNADGSLASVTIAHSTAQAYGSNSPVVTGPTGTGTLRSTIATDVMGRVTEQLDRDEGGAVIYHRQVTGWWDHDGRMKTEKVVRRVNDTNGPSTITTDSTYHYGDRGSLNYALGQVTGVSATIGKVRSDGTQSADSSGTAYSYDWYDGPTQSGVSTSSNDDPSYTTSYQFNGAGALTGASVTGYNARTVTIVNDVLGQAIWRDEGGTAPLTESWYRFDGRQIGTAGTSTTDRANWDATITQRGNASGSSRIDSNGDWSGAYEAFNSYGQGSAQGSYTVRAGDTLAGIAASLWGDAGLWYKIAQTNGLAGADASLTAGTILQLPANVVRTTNSAATFRPYDPTDAYGDTSPSTPTPQGAGRKNKCGVFGQILLVAVAVAVTIASSGALLAASGAAANFGAGVAATLGLAGGAGVAGSAVVGAGIIGAAVGSAVSQGLGVATGIQQQFSWKGVALAAISGGVGGGLGVAGVGGAGVAGAALRGALGSAITQGIGVATKLQSRFDFVGVAAAGVVGGVGRAIAPQGASFGRQLLAGAASSLAGAATRSAISGTSFGDNIMAVLPDVIGSTVGRLAARALASRPAVTPGGIPPSENSSEASRPGSGDDAAAIKGRFFVDPRDASGVWTDDVIPTTNDIVVTARRFGESAKKTGLGILDRLDRFLGTNVFGHNPSREAARFDNISYFFRPSTQQEVARVTRGKPDVGFNASQPSTVRAWVLQRRLSDGVSGMVSKNLGGSSSFNRYVTTPISTTLGTINRYAFGPGTLIDNTINKPFYAAAGIIANSPVGDTGVITSLEQSGTGVLTGEVLRGIRALNALKAEANALQRATIDAKAPLQLGGAYRDVKGIPGYEAHHMPSNSSSPLSLGEGPAIAMLAEHHRETLSWGRSAEARAHQQAQAALIRNGDFRGAQQMDINDIRSKFGNRYNNAIDEMLYYTDRRGLR